MSVRKIRNHGTWVWQARVAYRGARRSAIRETKELARQATMRQNQFADHSLSPATMV